MPDSKMNAVEPRLTCHTNTAPSSTCHEDEPSIVASSFNWIAGKADEFIGSLATPETSSVAHEEESKSYLESACDFIQSGIQQCCDFGSDLFTSVYDYIGSGFEDCCDYVVEIFDDCCDFVSSSFKDCSKSVSKTYTGFASFFVTYFSSCDDAVSCEDNRETRSSYLAFNASSKSFTQSLEEGEKLQKARAKQTKAKKLIAGRNEAEKLRKEQNKYYCEQLQKQKELEISRALWA